MQDNEIQKLVQTSIELKILEAFKEAPDLIEKLIQAAISQEVDGHGQKPNGYSQEKMPYLTWATRDAVQKVAKDAVIEKIQELSPTIRRQVRASLAEDVIIDAFTNSVLAATKQDWKINVTFETTTD